MENGTVRSWFPGERVSEKMPDAVTLVEVGPRDGFQFERKVVALEQKLAVIRSLAAAGLQHIQVTSFVHPLKVPQMADAEALVAALSDLNDLRCSALVLNPHGLERALASGIAAVEISLSASDTHSRNNAGLSAKAALGQGLAMIEKARAAGLHVRAGIQCAFGCVHEGAIPVARIAEMVSRFVACSPQELALADTTGMASPPLVEAVLSKVLPQVGNIPVALHLHDTRGLGLVNLMVALKHGITIFDTALAGMGGCPFVPGAAGNIATEDTCHLLHALGIQTGVDPLAVGAISRELETFFDKTFPGRLHRLPPTYLPVGPTPPDC